MNKNVVIAIVVASILLIVGLVVFFVVDKKSSNKSNTSSGSSGGYSKPSHYVSVPSNPTPSTPSSPATPPPSNPTPVNPTPSLPVNPSKPPSTPSTPSVPKVFNIPVQFGTPLTTAYSPYILTTQSPSIPCPTKLDCTGTDSITLDFKVVNSCKLGIITLNSYFDANPTSFKIAGALGNQEQMGTNDITNSSKVLFTVVSKTTGAAYILNVSYLKQDSQHKGNVGSLVSYNITNDVIIPPDNYVLTIKNLQQQYLSLFYQPNIGGIRIDGAYSA